MVAQTKHFWPAGPRIQASNSSISKQVGLKGDSYSGVKLAIDPNGVNMQNCSDNDNRTTTFNKRRSQVVERLHTTRVSRPPSLSTRLEKEHELKNLRMVSLVNSPVACASERKTPSISKQIEYEDANEAGVNNGFTNFWSKFIPCVPNTKSYCIDSPQNNGLSSKQVETDGTNKSNVIEHTTLCAKFLPCMSNSKICLTDTPQNGLSDDSLLGTTRCDPSRPSSLKKVGCNNFFSKGKDGKDEGKTEEANKAIEIKEMKEMKEVKEVKETVGRNCYDNNNGLSDIVMFFFSKISVCGKRY